MTFPAHPFYMIRHGETVANKENWFSGSIDTPLTNLGRQQADIARQIVEKLTDQPDAIIHSHLSRARDTAAIINQNLGLPMREDTDYAEMFVGEWQSKHRDNFIHQWFHYEDPPGGERFDEFFARIKRAKLRCLGAGHRLPLVVCHGGVFRAFGKLYDMQIGRVKNCALYRFDPALDAPSFPWIVTSFTLDCETLRSHTDHLFQS